MEALVALLAEFLLPLILILLAPIVAVLMGIVTGIIELVLSIMGATVPFLRRSRRGAAPNAAAPKWPRRVALGLASMVGALLVLAILLSTVFFESTLRWAFGKVQDRTGIEVTFEEASGNFMTGRLSASGLRVRRTESDSATFDLRIERAELETRVTAVFGSAFPLYRVSVEGVRGTYERLAPPAGNRGKSFTIDLLEIEDAQLTYLDHPEPDRTVEVELKVSRLESKPFESRHPVLSVLFRSNAEGSIDGAPFSITTTGSDEGRVTAWMAEKVPISLLADYAGGPLAWIKEGTVDLDVKDSWKQGEKTEIHMDWNVVLRNVRAEAPKDDSKLTRMVAVPVVAYLNARSEELPLRFSLVMDEEAFKAKWSLGAAGLWGAVQDSLVRSLAEKAKVKPETLKDLGRSAWGSFKKFLDRKRKGKQEK